MSVGIDKLREIALMQTFCLLRQKIEPFGLTYEETNKLLKFIIVCLQSEIEENEMRIEERNGWTKTVNGFKG